jgi:hypothetical protein
VFCPKREKAKEKKQQEKNSCFIGFDFKGVTEIKVNGTHPNIHRRFHNQGTQR